MPRAETRMQQIRGWLNAHRGDLVDKYQQALRAVLFTNRLQIRPGTLRQVATAEAETLLDFFRHPLPTTAQERGQQLCQIGLSTEAVIRLGQTTYAFCAAHPPEDLRLLVLETVEAYRNAMMQGFVQTQQDIVLEEQERIRSALQRTLTRYAIQMEAAADVARATTSILKLDELLQTTVDLIRERFDLDYAGIFLADETDRWATLQAASGRVERETHLYPDKLALDADTIVGWCITHGEPRVALDVDRQAFAPPSFPLPSVRSEMAVPLISRGQTIGTLVVQSHRPNAFSEQDVTVFGTIAAQTAIAIANAGFFKELYQAKEAADQARRAAEAASQAKSTFLANMSHELRTPLNAIIGYSELLREEAVDLGYEGMLSDLKKIRSAGTHLLTLINDVLDLSKVEAGKTDLHLETFDVGEMVHAVALTVKPLVEQQENTLTSRCAQDSGWIHADMTKVRQILINLLNNAAKFTRAGQITFSAEREQGEDRDWLIFQVTDTGIGIPSERLAEVFEPFTQADASTTRKYGGTGLGLAISQRFCEMMGGSIAAQSEPDVGSVFSVRLPAVVVAPSKVPDALPITVPPPVPEATPAIVGLERQRGTVLVIDDDPAARDIITRCLRKAGLGVVTAPDGEQGLQQARARQPDAVTLDVLMPSMDGWAVLKAFKSDPGLSDIPVIMLTVADNANLGLTLGAAEYMNKPVDCTRLAATLNKYLTTEGDQQLQRVLIVEDDANTREILRRTLEKDGWQVSESENGRQALAHLGVDPPAVIVLDLMMPEMDGFEFLAALRRHPEHHAIPVVVVTAKELTPEDHARLSGAVEHVLHKGSYRCEDLLQALRVSLEDELIDPC